MKLLSILLIRTIEVLENSNTPEIKFKINLLVMNEDNKDDNILKNIILKAIEKIDWNVLFITSKYISSNLLLIWILIFDLSFSLYLNFEKYKKINEVKYKEIIEVIIKISFWYRLLYKKLKDGKNIYKANLFPSFKDIFLFLTKFSTKIALYGNPPNIDAIITDIP